MKTPFYLVAALTLTLGSCGDSSEGGKTAANPLEPAVDKAAAIQSASPEQKTALVAPIKSATTVSDPGKGGQIYDATCKICHKEGVAGAPKLGDESLWGPRIAKGMDALMMSVVNGVPGTAMPPRGTCITCTDEDLKAAVEYMVANSR